MKGAFSWNPDCSTISIFIKTSHCGVGCAAGDIVCGREQATQREGGRRRIDKQSESQGVAQSDKLNVMNVPSSKK